VNAELTLPLTTWRTPFPLPLTMPIVADAGGGVPEIHGFNFAYRDASYPLRQASVKLSTDEDALEIEAMYRIGMAPVETLFARSFDALQQHLTLLATRITTEDTSDA
jgi:hypothetical protein